MRGLEFGDPRTKPQIPGREERGCHLESLPPAAFLHFGKTGAWKGALAPRQLPGGASLVT